MRISHTETDGRGEYRVFDERRILAATFEYGRFGATKAKAEQYARFFADTFNNAQQERIERADKVIAGIAARQ